MFEVNARDLLALDAPDLWRLPDGPMRVTFDDGILETTGKATKISWYFWEFFKIDPEVPLNTYHHVGNRGFTKSTQLTLLGKCLFDVYLYRVHRGQAPALHISNFARMAYQIVNRLYNDLTYLLEEYVVTLKATDFVEVLDHPRIAEINKNINPTYADIERAYKEIKEILYDPTELKTNRIALAVRAGILSVGQVMQVSSCIGYRTGADSKRFQVPVMSNYSEGIYDGYESLVDSQSGTKAIASQSQPLQQTQYYQREMQLEVIAVKHVKHFSDCGTKHTLPFVIRNRHDLTVCHGKWRVDENGNRSMITPKQTELIGKLINIRAVSQCEHVDGKICSVCYGELYHSVQETDNIGHSSLVEICKRISQIVLSTKHLDQNAKVDEFEVTAGDARYLTVDNQDSTFRLKPWVKDKLPKLSFSVQEARNLALLKAAPNLAVIPKESIGEFSIVKLALTTRSGTSAYPLSVSMGSRKAVFTYEFLEYLLTAPKETTPDRFYEVSLENWDFSKPFMSLPDKHTNMLEYKNLIENFIKAGKDYSDRVGHPVTDDEISNVLQEFNELISTKLTINLVHLEIVLYSTMIISSAEKNYSLPTPKTTREFATYSSLMRMRSLSQLMAHQGQREAFYDNDSYLVKNRVPGTLDAILMPKLFENNSL